MESTAFAALCGLCGLKGESSRGRFCVFPAAPCSTASPDPRVRFGGRFRQPEGHKGIPNNFTRKAHQNKFCGSIKTKFVLKGPSACWTTQNLTPPHPSPTLITSPARPAVAAFPGFTAKGTWQAVGACGAVLRPAAPRGPAASVPRGVGERPPGAPGRAGLPLLPHGAALRRRVPAVTREVT